MMLHGIERIARAVSVTLGPKGRNVIIRQANGEPKITKDGVTVARSIEFRNQFEDVGAKLIRQVASKTNDYAGDGTTTATVLAWSIFCEGYKSVATGANPMDLKRGIDVAVDVILESLRVQRREVTDKATLEHVATISANGERPLGTLIAEAVSAVGASGFIAVMDGRTPQTTWQRHRGWSTETGFINSALVTDANELTSTHENAVVFVCGEVMASVDDTLRLLEAAKEASKPLVLIAPGFSDDVVETVRANHVAGVVRCCLVVPAPMDGVFEDVAASCGCPVSRGDSIGRLASSLQSVLGHATEVSQSMDCTVVVGAAEVASRVRLLHSKMERTLDDASREKLRERIAKLTGKFAVIRVGGMSSVAIGESKDRVIDALNSARAAIEEGIVAGGGAALLHATKQLDAMLLADEEMEQDRRTGILIVRNAARLPIKLIANNAGVEGPVVVDNVAEEQDTARGYDAQNDIYCDMFAAGIVDPVRVVRSCIIDAASVAGLMITTEASVCDHDGLVQ